MAPLTDDEVALLYHVMRWGSQGYPIRKLQSKWIIDSWRSWKGFPTTYKTKKAAQAQFERWVDLANERWMEHQSENPNAIMTAVGIR